MNFYFYQHLYLYKSLTASIHVLKTCRRGGVSINFNIIEKKYKKQLSKKKKKH